MNISNICVLCLEQGTDLLDIFGTRGSDLNIASILKEHFWFEIGGTSVTEERYICEKCWESVESFDNFYNFVKSIHRDRSCVGETKFVDVLQHTELIDRIKEEPDTDIKADLNTSCDNEYPVEPTVNIKLETNDDTKDNEEQNRQSKSKRKRAALPETSAEESLPKKYKTDSHTSLLSKYFKMNCELCDSLLESYREVNNHYKDVHDLEKGYLVCCGKKFYRLQLMLQHCDWHNNPDSFKCTHCTKLFPDENRLRDHLNHCHTPDSDKLFSCDECCMSFSKLHYLSAHLKKGHSSNASEDKPVRKQRVNLDKEHEMIRKRFLMQCDICAEPYQMFRDAQLHHLKAHDQAGYLYCCDRKFFKMFKAVQHCVWHDDPEAFKCSFCQKCFTDKIGLRDHIRNVHSPEDERQFQCDVCKKSFAKSYLLRSHLKVNHVKDEDKKFECHICGIRFVIVSFLRSHINRVHRNVHSHICELCAKPFKSGKSYELHYINAHTNISQRVQCETCGKWLKHKTSLKKHMLWHNSKTETCGVCGRVSTNIRALRAHMRSAHREASLECTICGKMFKKQQVLKEHMAIHAGITDLYTCTFCTKTFRSNANMYSHRKRSHPVELERKKSGLPAAHQ